MSDSLRAPWTIYSLPGSSVHGIFQASRLEWVTISYSKGSYQPRDWTHVSCITCIGRWILYHQHQDTQHIICCPSSHLTLPVFEWGVGMWPKLSNQRIIGLSFGSLGQKLSFLLDNFLRICRTGSKMVADASLLACGCARWGEPGESEMWASVLTGTMPSLHIFTSRFFQLHKP